MALNPQLTEMVQQAKAKYFDPPQTEQERFLDMLEETVTWEVHNRGQIRIMSERGSRLLSVHLPSEFLGSPDYRRLKRAFTNLMAVLTKVEEPGFALLGMQAGLADAMTRVAILEEAFDRLMAEHEDEE